MIATDVNRFAFTAIQFLDGLTASVGMAPNTLQRE